MIAHSTTRPHRAAHRHVSKDDSRRLVFVIRRRERRVGKAMQFVRKCRSNVRSSEDHLSYTRQHLLRLSLSTGFTLLSTGAGCWFLIFSNPVSSRVHFIFLLLPIAPVYDFVCVGLSISIRTMTLSCQLQFVTLQVAIINSIELHLFYFITCRRPQDTCNFELRITDYTTVGYQ